MALPNIETRLSKFERDKPFITALCTLLNSVASRTVVFNSPGEDQPCESYECTNFKYQPPSKKRDIDGFFHTIKYIFTGHDADGGLLYSIGIVPLYRACSEAATKECFIKLLEVFYCPCTRINISDVHAYLD
jgi:hypothetical protein